jgi:AraC family transcriptional regulator
MEPLPGRTSEVERLMQEGLHRSSVDVRQFAQPELSPVSPCRRPPVCDLLDATVQIPPIGLVERHSMGSHGLATESIYAPAGIRIDCRFDAPVHLLVMYDGARRTGETSIVGLARSGLRNLTNKLTFVPAGHAYYEWHETATPTRVTFLYLDPAWCSKSSNAVALDAPRILFEDHVVLETAVKLKSSIENGQSGNMLYAEAVASVLALELLRSHEAFARTSLPVKRGGLASWQTRGITANIEEHLGEQTSLLTLALRV